jgi:hypothetical protein
MNSVSFALRYAFYQVDGAVVASSCKHGAVPSQYLVRVGPLSHSLIHLQTFSRQSLITRPVGLYGSFLRIFCIGVIGWAP